MENELSILTTYLAGSPLPGAHFRKQEQDHNTMMSAGMFGGVSLFPGIENKLAFGGADIEILLGVNTWQHVWLMDWGVGGKKQFLEGWWSAIDWAEVEKNIQKEIKDEQRKDKPLKRLGEVGRPKFRTVESPY